MVLCGKELLYALVIMLSSFMLGSAIVYPSPTGGEICKLHNLPDDSILWAFFNSCSMLFAMFGPGIMRFLLRIFHNKKRPTCFVVSLAATILWFLLCLTKLNIWYGIAVRALMGLVMGVNGSLPALYLVEIAPQGLTGLFGSLNQIGVALAQAFTNFIGSSVNFMEMNYVLAVFPALQCVLIWFIKESPAANQTMNDNSLMLQENESVKPKESVWQKKYIGRLIAGIGTMFFQQWCGINAIVTNQKEIMDKAGFDLDGNYQSGISSLAQVLGLFIGGAIIDKLGRKMIWTLSSVIITLASLLFAINAKIQIATFLPLICLFVFQFGYGFGIGSLCWFLIPEYIEDLDVRASAAAVIATPNFIFAFLIILLWPIMESSMGMFGTFLLFTSVSFCSVLFGVFYVYEPPNYAALNITEESLISQDSTQEFTQH